jgi:hypothetical protein
MASTVVRRQLGRCGGGGGWEDAAAAGKMFGSWLVFA